MLSFAVLREFSELELSGTLQTEAFIAPTGDTQAGALGSSRMFVVVVHGVVHLYHDLCHWRGISAVT